MLWECCILDLNHDHLLGKHCRFIDSEWREISERNGGVPGTRWHLDPGRIGKARALDETKAVGP
jgi:hypothetical protein